MRRTKFQRVVAIMLALACCVILISDMPLKQFLKMVAVLGVVGVALMTLGEVESCLPPA